MANTYELGGSVGSLTGSAMETAGHMAQSRILDLLDQPFGKSLVGLLYLVGIVAAIITTASGGSYRFAKWLLIGPAIYFFLVGTRVPSDGAEWRFGDRVRDMARVFEADQGLLEGGNGGRAGRVSKFFLIWDRLTSDIVQEFIRLLNLTRDGSDLSFIAKADRYLDTFAVHSNDPFLTLLLNVGLNNSCSRVYALQRVINDPDVTPDRKRLARDALRAMGENSARFNLNEYRNPDIYTWVVRVLDGSAGDDFVGPRLSEKYTRPIGCKDLWELATVVTRKAFTEEYVEHLMSYRLPAEANPEDVRRTLLRKFGMRVQNGRVVQDTNISDEQRLTYLINELVARVITREMTQMQQHLAALGLGEHRETMIGETGEKLDQETSRAIRSTSYADEFQYKGELIAGALVLPHLQGMALYFLAMAFPLFALVTVMPGRHRAIVTWMGLWLWIKLWDFGIAVLMLVDNLLYALLPHGPPLENADLLEPGKAINVIFEVDPVYSAHTYYNLMACCMFAIPVVTAFIMHKGGSEMVSALSEGFKEFPTAFGNSLAAYQRSMMVQRNIAEVQRHIYDEVTASAWQAVFQDAEVRQAFSTALAMEGGRQLTSAAINSGSAAFTDSFMNSFRGTPAAMDAVQRRAFQLLRDQNKNYALARVQANLQMVAYQASHSDFAVSRAAQSVSWNWNSHDMGHRPPSAALMHAYQMRDYNPVGQVRDEFINQAQQLFFGPRSTPR